MLTLYSWNVNGIRAAVRNGLLDWLADTRPDVLCVQEIKARVEDVDEAIRCPNGYQSVWNPAERKGYSGTATFFRDGLAPVSVDVLGVEAFDVEGRVQALKYDDFTLINAYFPNSQPERARIDYKLAFCKAIRMFCNKLRRQGDDIVLCGDYNIAHKEIDLARPKENVNNPGFLPEERASMDTFIRAGYVDTFRRFNKEPGQYTWWSYRGRARENNVGWRLDYHCVNKEFLPRVKRSWILPEVLGSDHCPVALAVE